MKEQIRINYGKLEKHSGYIGDMIDAFGRTRGVVASSRDLLAGHRGAAAEALLESHDGLIALIDATAEDFAFAKMKLDAYRVTMEGMVPASDRGGDVIVNRVDFEELVAAMKSETPAAFEAEPITPTNEEYIAWHCIGKSYWSETETWKYELEMQNGDTIARLRDVERVQALDSCMRIVSEVENYYCNNILFFFKADAEFASNLPDVKAYTEPGTFSCHETYLRTYAMLMPGGKPDFEYLKKLMKEDPDKLGDAQLDAMAAMFRQFAIGLGSSDAAAWDEAKGNIDLFVQNSYLSRPQPAIKGIAPAPMQSPVYTAFIGRYLQKYPSSTNGDPSKLGHGDLGSFQNFGRGVLATLLTGLLFVGDRFVNVGGGMTSAANYAENMKRTFSAHAAIIDNQWDGGISGLRYGHTTMGPGGCGVIAVHNALIKLGQASDIRDVIADYDRHGILFFGNAGTNPLEAAWYLDEKGYQTTYTTIPSRFEPVAASSDMSLLTYQNPDGASMHTVAVERGFDANGDTLYTIYNPGYSVMAEGYAPVGSAFSVDGYLDMVGGSPVAIVGVNKE
ncbi:MAG: hypothetical protein LBS91_07220 [Clostridiales Family XIII bacterium]|jgi:hypothetical protein|nr:hypothetical protein [Clostridiales Family XIII bacterium]